MSGGGGGSNEIPETESEKALARIAAEKWKLYQDDFVGAENDYMNLVDQLGEEGRVQLTEDIGRQTAQQVAGQDVSQATSKAGAAGVNPASGRFRGVLAAGGRATGERIGGAVNEAYRGMRGAHLTGIQNVTSMGLGQQTEAQQGMSHVAGLAQQEAARNTREEFNETSAMQRLAGMGAGMGISYASRGLGGGSAGTDATITDTNLQVPNPPGGGGSRQRVGRGMAGTRGLRGSPSGSPA